MTNKNQVIDLLKESFELNKKIKIAEKWLNELNIPDDLKGLGLVGDLKAFKEEAAFSFRIIKLKKTILDVSSCKDFNDAWLTALDYFGEEVREIHHESIWNYSMVKGYFCYKGDYYELSMSIIYGESRPNYDEDGSYYIEGFKDKVFEEIGSLAASELTADELEYLTALKVFEGF